MKEVTKLMIKKYALMKLKYDFMGYEFQRSHQLSFHHLIVPRRLCKQEGLGEGYLEWNGAILRQDTSHDYLHVIEHYDPDIFASITSEMIDINIKGYVDMANLREIDDMLRYFEREHCSDRTKKGSLIIKPEYTRRLLKK